MGTSDDIKSKIGRTKNELEEDSMVKKIVLLGDSAVGKTSLIRR